MGLLDQWNKNKFSIYKNEEKTVLKLLESISKWLEKIIIGLDGKTDLYGDHKGSWQGLSKPTLSEEGMRATVEQLIDETIPHINSQMEHITNYDKNNNILYAKKHFNLKTDGTDCSQEFINMCNFISNKENIKLIFEPGVYNLENVIDAKIINTKKLLIEGNKAELKRTSCDTPKSFIFIDNCIDITIKDLNFTGAGQQATINSNEDGLQFRLCEDVKVLNCKFFGLGGCSIRVGHGTDSVQQGPINKVVVDGCTFEQCFQTSTTPSGCTNYIFTNNIIYNTAGSCKFASRYEQGKNLIIVNNIVRTTSNLNVQGGFEIAGYSNITIKNNIIESRRDSGIVLYNNDRVGFNNMIDSVDISDNKISVDYKNGIFINSQLLDGIKKLTINNNHITLNHVDTNYYAISINGLTINELIIKDNNIYNTPSYAIDFNNDNTSTTQNINILVKNNNFENCKHGIVIRKNIKSLEVINNSFNINNFMIASDSKSSFTLDKLVLHSNNGKSSYADLSTSIEILDFTMTSNRIIGNICFDVKATKFNISNNTLIASTDTGQLMRVRKGIGECNSNAYLTNHISPISKLDGATVFESGFYYGKTAPTTAPQKIGQLYLDKTNKKLYIATDITEVGDWVLLN